MNTNDNIQVLSITENDLNAKSSETAFYLSSPNQNLSAFNNLDSSSQTSPNGVTAPENIPIAIVGIAMRLPGGISNEEELWDTLINKKDKRTLVPADRWNVDGFYSETPNEALLQFDASLFSITRAELERLDPQHRLLLEVTRECLENAGEVNWRGKNIGCYVGVFGEDWLAMHAQDTQDSGLYRITGVGDFLLANRISYEYDFKGPSITVKTGCSAAMIGLHMACQAIKAGEISSAIVGGTNLLLTPSVTIAMTEQGVLSPDGSCKTFDAAADGYAGGEAINTLYVKRLDEAIRDGNPIRAIVRSTATNCDGKTLGISYPSDESQENLIRRAYELAGLHDFCQSAVVECHGTGTAIGDRQETTAVGNVFGERGVYITSVKPSLGHSEGASGLTSVMKSVLALERKTVLPNVKFQTPNPQIPFKEMKLQVPVEATPWPENRDKRVSVNSFGRVSIVISGVVYASEILEKSDDSAGNQNPHGGLRLHWKPDIDFLDPKKLIRPTKSAKELIPALQKLVLLCSIEAQKRLSRLSTTVPHLRKFKSWLNAQVEKAEATGCLFVEDSKKLIALSSIDRIALIEAIAMEIKSPVSVAVKRIFEAIEGIFKGEIDPLELLMQDGALSGWLLKAAS